MLEEIQQEMLELLSEASELVRDTDEREIYERARAYWIAQIETIIHNDHGYLGGSMCSMQDTIDELIEIDKEAE